MVLRRTRHSRAAATAAVAEAALAAAQAAAEVIRLELFPLLLRAAVAETGGKKWRLLGFSRLSELTWLVFFSSKV